MKRFTGKNSPAIEPSVDIILMILNAAHAARPEAALISSFLQQYRERGGLSKKQLEGLHSKASKIENISPAHLATLQPIISKRPDREKSEYIPTTMIQPKDLELPVIAAILEKYPAHKRILFFKMKIDKKEPLNNLEKDELKKFEKILLK